MKVRIGKTIILVAVAALAAGVIGGGAYLALRDETKPVEDPTALVPGDAVFVVEIGPLREVAPRLDALGAAVSPDDWPSARSRFWERAGESIGVKDPEGFERDWGVDVGRPSAVAVVAWPKDGAPARSLLLLPLKTPTAFRERMAARAGTAKEEEHEGQRLSVAETSAWAVIGGYGVVAEGAETLKKAIEAEAGRAGSLRDDPVFAGGRLRGDVSAWLRGAPVAEAARSSFAAFAPLVMMTAGDRAKAIEAIVGAAFDALDRIEGAAFALDLDPAAPRLKTRFALDPAWPVLAALAEPPSAFPLLERVPAAPVVFAAAFDNEALFRAGEPLLEGLLAAAGAGAETSAWIGRLRAQAEALGGDMAGSLRMRFSEGSPFDPPAIVAASIQRARDTAAAERGFSLEAAEAGARIGAAFTPKAVFRAEAVRPIDLGGRQARGIRMRITTPAPMSPEDAKDLPPEIRARVTVPQTQEQVTYLAAGDDVVFSAFASSAADAETALREIAAGPAAPASADPGVAALRALLPAEGHGLVVVDPAVFVGAEESASFALFLRLAEEGVVEGEWVWPTSHIAALARAAAARMAGGVPAIPAEEIPPPPPAAP